MRSADKSQKVSDVKDFLRQKVQKIYTEFLRPFEDAFFIMKDYINSLKTEYDFQGLLKKSEDKEFCEKLRKSAEDLRNEIYGKRIFIRGLIEISSYCKNDCFYCGIRCSNKNAERYRLTKEEILSCCEKGNSLGFKTFVLQGGEDGFYTDDRMCDIVSSIKEKYPDCAVTLSLGEKTKESYKRLFDAGADRYLLRHETADDIHYKKLHPENLTLENRKRCLYDLKDIGYQVGAGFMVGSPYQTDESIAKDLLFLKELNPHMVGIGPFIPHKDTDFRDFESGSVEKTLFLLSVIRLMLPNVLLPATTALGTLCKNGRERGIMAGANVIMPNLSPQDTREKYSLYDNKLASGCEAAENLEKLKKEIEITGCTIAVDKGDYKNGIQSQINES